MLKYVLSLTFLLHTKHNQRRFMPPGPEGNKDERRLQPFCAASHNKVKDRF
jgi:hypothetical protein